MRSRNTAWMLGLAGSLSALAGLPAAPAQAAAESGLAGLRAEISMARTLLPPGQPTWVRFTLYNPTSQPIDIPGPREGDGLSLPPTLVFGAAEQPAVQLTFADEKPIVLHPAAGPAEASGQGVIRLGPRSSLGTEIDIQPLPRQQLRYPGVYRLEWKPFGDKTPPATLDFRLEARQVAKLITDYGTITFHLMYDTAPKNVENFVDLCRQKFYDGKGIHRIVPNFIVQGGSPDGTPSGIRPDGKLVPGEFREDVPFREGTLAMARKLSDPDSASCQFFFSLARLPDLDGKYTVIGQATDEASLRVLKQIGELPAHPDGRPVRPVTIRFFTLVDSDLTTPQRVEVTSKP